MRGAETAGETRAGWAAAVPARGTSSRDEASRADTAVARARAVVPEVMEGLRSRRWVLRTGTILVIKGGVGIVRGDEARP
ncbi:hypothetical protein GCM10018789_03070 [Streptomyces werraensis]|nr:hypothetical protein GCM10018789_03070 [Streptomyces werraensis]